MRLTGASRSIGATIAQAAARAGAMVIVNYAGSRAEADAITGAGGEALAGRADVRRAGGPSPRRPFSSRLLPSLNPSECRVPEKAPA